MKETQRSITGIKGNKLGTSPFGFQEKVKNRADADGLTGSTFFILYISVHFT